jgi:hypothetical protein
MIQIRQLREDLEVCAEQHKDMGTAIFLPAFHKAQREAQHDFGHDGIDRHLVYVVLSLVGIGPGSGHVRAAHQDMVTASRRQ